jgi:LacI family transcriptional regulator
MEKRYFSFLDKKLIDGLIMIASIAEDWEILEMAKKIPTTLIERTIMDSDIDSVISDERCGMEQLIGYLVLNGHTKIGFINGEKGTSSADRRLKAFKVSMESAGLEYIEERVFHAKWSLNGGKETFIRMMENKCDVTAVICASDQMALGALGAAYKLGMSVPKDISIVGFDNFDEGEVSVPPLTTLKYPAFDIGVHAARCLIDRIGNNGKMAENYILPISLLERDSVLKI